MQFPDWCDVCGVSMEATLDGIITHIRTPLHNEKVQLRQQGFLTAG